VKHLGLDYGTKRIGIALSDEGGGMAFPVSVIENDGTALGQITEIILKEKVGVVVMGESKNLSGAPNLIFEEVARFAKLIEQKTGVKVLFQPEMYTSYEAGRIGSSEKMLDASAATLILNSFLQKPHSRDDARSV
jgi:putative holliday junction resolvase